MKKIILFGLGSVLIGIIVYFTVYSFFSKIDVMQKELKTIQLNIDSLKHEQRTIYNEDRKKSTIKLPNKKK